MAATGLEQLLSGLKVFDQGVEDFAIAAGTSDANDQLRALQEKFKGKEDTKEFAQQRNQITQDLSLRLTRAGADASQIQAATSRIAPTLGAQMQSQLQTQLQKESHKQQFDILKEKQKGDLELASLKLEAKKQAAIPKLVELKANPDVDHSKANTEIVRKGSEDAQTLFNLMNQVREVFRESGTEAMGTNVGKIKNLLGTIKTIYKGKTFADLGVINGGDEKLLEEIISGSDDWTPDFTGSLEARLNQFSKNTADRLRIKTKVRGFEIEKGTALEVETIKNSLPLRQVPNYLKHTNDKNKTLQERDDINRQIKLALGGDTEMQELLKKDYKIDLTEKGMNPGAWDRLAPNWAK